MWPPQSPMHSEAVEALTRTSAAFAAVAVAVA